MLKSNAFLIENATPNPRPNPTLDPPVFYTPKQTRAQSRISKVKISPFKKIKNFLNEIRNDQKKHK